MDRDFITFCLPEDSLSQALNSLIQFIEHLKERECVENIALILPKLTIEQSCLLGEALVGTRWKRISLAIEDASEEQSAYFYLIFCLCMRYESAYFFVNGKVEFSRAHIEDSNPPILPYLQQYYSKWRNSISQLLNGDEKSQSPSHSPQANR